MADINKQGMPREYYDIELDELRGEFNEAREMVEKLFDASEVDVARLAREYQTYVSEPEKLGPVGWKNMMLVSSQIRLRHSYDEIEGFRQKYVPY